MRYLVRGAPCVVALCVMLAIGAPDSLVAQDDDVGIAVGATPPATTVQDLNGAAVDLSRWVGKQPVLFEFWATWCPICAELLPKMKAVHAQYGDRVEFVVMAVAVNESRASVKRHLESHDLPFTFLWDSAGNATRAFQAPATSYVVVLDAKGKVAYTGVGADQDLEAALRRVTR
jgi:thiol-disulfide isomerase/thioredoxin